MTKQYYYLSHHGIKGQKRGVRRFQNPDGSLTDAGRKRYYQPVGNKKIQNEAKSAPTANAPGLKGASKKTEGKLEVATASANTLQYNKEYTVRDAALKEWLKHSALNDNDRHTDFNYDKNKNRSSYTKKLAAAAGLGLAGNVVGGARVGLVVPGAIVGASSAAVTLAAGSSRYISAKHAEKKLESVQKKISENQKVDQKTGVKLINGAHSEKDDLAMVNPGYKNWSDATKMNCFKCSLTYDLRRRGYDVNAGGADKGYFTTDAMKLYKNATYRKMGDRPTDFKNNVKSLPEGSSGVLAVDWKSGGGHAMYLKIQDGKPVISCPQSNKVYKGSSAINLLSKATNYEFVRLDNASPDWGAIKKAGMVDPTGQSNKYKTLAHGDSVTGKYYYISHWGIKGQKWGRRRFRNYDDTLTEAGKKRYGDGKSWEERKADWKKKRREKILADPNKLYKHRSEFSKKEIDAAMRKFDTAEQLKRQTHENEQAARQREIDKQKQKFEWENEKTREKVAQEKSKAELKNIKQAGKIAKQEAKDKREKEKKEKKNKKWTNRAAKLKGILESATSAKGIFDELGITDKEDGKTLFSTLGIGLGFKDKPASEAKTESSSKAGGQSSDSKPKTESTGKDKTPSDSNKHARDELIKNAMDKTSGLFNRDKSKESSKDKSDGEPSEASVEWAANVLSSKVNWALSSVTSNMDMKLTTPETVAKAMRQGKTLNVTDVLDKRTKNVKEFIKDSKTFETALKDIPDSFEFSKVLGDDFKLKS